MGFINQGSQFITFDFKHKAKGSDFNKLNRNVIRPGIYSGLKATYVGNNVFMSIGTCVFNCAYGVEDNLQVKVNFNSLYDYGVINPTTLGQNEVLYLEYEYGEVIENYVDFKHTSYNSFDFNNENLIIIGEIVYDGSYNISSISYTNRSFGFNNADLDYAIPDNTRYYNIEDETKFFEIDGRNLSSGERKIVLPNFSENEGNLLISTATNTVNILNNITVSGTSNLKNVFVEGNYSQTGNSSVSGRLSVGSFYGRVPIGSVIPIIGVFQSTSNSGTFTSASLPSSGSITDDGFQRCDGSIINNASSIFNGKYTPNISDNRFIQGSTSAGEISSDTGVNNGDNTVTLISSNLPTHTHDISHTHTGSTTSQSTTTTGNDSPDHTHNIERAGGNSSGTAMVGTNAGFASTFQTGVVSGASVRHTHSYSHSHNISTTTQDTVSSGNGGFSNTAIDIRPKYINAVYLIRVL
jgi:hypothetical protein